MENIYPVLLPLSVLILLISTPGNTAVILIYTRNNRLNHVGVLIIGLAVNDLIGAIVNFSWLVYEGSHPHDEGVLPMIPNDEASTPDRILDLFNSVVALVSLFLIAAVAMDRYNIVKHPAGVRKDIKKAVLLVLLLTILALILSIFAFIGSYFPAILNITDCLLRVIITGVLLMTFVRTIQIIRLVQRRRRVDLVIPDPGKPKATEPPVKNQDYSTSKCTSFYLLILPFSLYLVNSMTMRQVWLKL